MANIHICPICDKEISESESKVKFEKMMIHSACRFVKLKGEDEIFTIVDIQDKGMVVIEDPKKIENHKLLMNDIEPALPMMTDMESEKFEKT